MVTREQVKMARAAMGWGVRDLAAKIGVAANTISRFENGSDAYGETLRKIRRAFEDEGIIFIDENGGGAGVRLKKRDER
jgi:transcriptional regulator with XRE-family HTH domain